MQTRKHEWISVAIGAFVGALLALIAVRIVDGDRASPTPPAAGPEIDVQRLGDELARRLAREQPSARPIDSSPADDVLGESGPDVRRSAIPAVGEDVGAAILRRIEGLEGRLSAIELALREGQSIDPPPSAELMRANTTPRNWEALGELHRRLREDPITAADSSRFMSYAEVLSTYGPPTSITRENMWYYRRSPQDERAPEWVRFLFIHGFVSNVQAGND